MRARGNSIWVSLGDLGTPPSCYHYQKAHREQAVQRSEQFGSPDESVPAQRSVPGHISFSGIGIIALTKGSHTWGATREVPQPGGCSICSVPMRNLADLSSHQKVWYVLV